MRKAVLRIAVFILVLLGGLFLYTQYELDAPNRRVRLAFNPYPDSELIYQAVLDGDPSYFGNLRNNVSVYWTSAPQTEVQRHKFVKNDNILARYSQGDYYVSDRMTEDQFWYATGPFSHDICAHRIDPRELTTINVFVLPANTATLDSLEPLHFGCSFKVQLVTSEIPVRDSGSYIIVGYNVW